MNAFSLKTVKGYHLTASLCTHHLPCLHFPSICITESMLYFHKCISSLYHLFQIASSPEKQFEKWRGGELNITVSSGGGERGIETLEKKGESGRRREHHRRDKGKWSNISTSAGYNIPFSKMQWQKILTAQKRTPDHVPGI